MTPNARTKKKTTLMTGEKHYEIAIFVMFFLAFLVAVPDIQRLNKWTAIYYVLSYADLGFQSRLIIGSLIRLFTGFITSRLIYAIMAIVSILFIAFISIALGRIVRNISKKTGTTAEGLILLFIACPISIQYLFNINNFGRFDLFSIMFTVLLAFCIKSEKTKWLIPFLCLFMMLLNYNFVLMYMPFVGIVMLYEYLFNSRTKARLLIFIISCILVVGLFIYFKILSPVPNFENINQLKIYLSSKTDIQGGEFPAFSDFCFPLTGIYVRNTNEAYSWFFDLLKVYGPFIIFSTAPVFMMLISFWREALKKTQQKTKKFIFWLCLAAPAVSLPMFLAIDWDRWFPTIFISQFMLVVYFIAVNDSDAVAALIRLKEYFSRHSFLFLIIIIYSASSIYSNSYSVYLSVMLKHIDNFLSFVQT